jgi:excisionase family DNA binding protein
MELLTFEEVRTVLRIDKKTLRKIIDSGALPALKVGVAANSPYRISEKALHDYIERESSKHAEAAQP